MRFVVKRYILQATAIGICALGTYDDTTFSPLQTLNAGLVALHRATVNPIALQRHVYNGNRSDR